MEINSINSTDNDLNTPLEESTKAISDHQDPLKPTINKNYGSSNVLSFIFFWWSKAAMSISNQQELKLTDLSYLTKEQTTAYSYPLIQEYFNRYSENKTRRYPLLYALFRYHVWSFLLLTIFNHIELSLHYVQIYFFRQIILHFSSNPNEPPSQLLFSLSQAIIGLILSKVLFTIISNQVKFFEVLLGEKITNQVNALLYNKVLITSIACSDKSKTEAEKLNLVDVDAEKVGFLFFVGPKLITAPIQLLSSFLVLFKLFGINFIYGFSALCLVLCGILTLQYMFLRNQRKLLKQKDEMMKIQTHVLHILKMLKMYGWDDECIDRIKEKKNEELAYLERNLTIIVVRSLLNNNLPLIMLIVTLGSYAYADQTFEISDLFTAIQLINSMTKPLIGIPMFINGFFSNLLSINRIQEYLYSKEHRFTTYEDPSQLSTAIRYSNCSFGIDALEDMRGSTKAEKPGTEVKSKTEQCDTSDDTIRVKPIETITVLSELSFEIKKGELVGVIGQTGSGKSCLLGSMMNNFDLLNKDELIINGALSFASQSPWIMNETIQNNILFNNEMQQERYDKVLEGCQLTQDLKQFSHGDRTEISSAGTTLSGGQKARLSLARAVYREADIYLLDDPLASVDSKVSNLIFKEVLFSLLKDKTRVIVINNIGHLEYVDKIIFMEQGSIKWIGTYTEFKKTYQDEFYQQTTEAKAKAKAKEKEEEKKEALSKRKQSYAEDNEQIIKRIPIMKEGKLIKEEEIGKGQIPLSLYHKYIRLKGGYVFFFLIVFLSFVVQLSQLTREIHVANWAQQSKEHKQTHQANLYNFSYYVEISAIGIITKFIIDFMVSKATVRTLRILHQSMILKLVKAPINLFHDIVPIGRILNRLTKDLERVKQSQHIVNRFIESIIALLIAIYVCYRYNPYSLLVSPFLLIMGLLVTNYYISAGRNLDRLHRTTFSPILSLLSESILGVETIRVSRNEERIKRKFYEKMDCHYAIHIFDEGAERWYSIVLDLLSHACYSFIVLFIIIYKNSFTAQAIGLILQYSASFSGQLTVTLESLTMIEKGMVSLERCDAYIFIPSEKSIPLKKSPLHKNKTWPSRGTICFTNYSTKYRPNTGIVLNQINLEIKSGEKIGIVGRTGSGKSTLSLALCRILEAETGKIEIDGIDISKLNLEYLRQRVCLVPQDPFVLEGTLRHNVDPLNKCKDREILDVFNQINLFSGLSSKEKLQMVIKNNGANLSVGQKQLIGFARAVLKKSKVIVLDEATSNLDVHTETTLKNNLKKYFSSSTLIIIAHRIQMVNNCDRIIVVDNGKIAEMGAYDELLKDKKSLFYSLYSESLKQ